MTLQSSDERRALIEKACKKIMDSLEETVQAFRGIVAPQVHDDYDKIHLDVLALGNIERELNYLYRKVLEVQHEVEVSRMRSKDILEDAKMEAVQKPTFKNPTSYSSRAETDGKLRSLTFEEHYDVATWDKLYKDTQYLSDTVKSYQQDAYKQRRDIETRLKILSQQF